MKMKIEDIIYQTTREIYSVEDKLSIATIFLFCEKLGSEKLAELIYRKDSENFIKELQFEFKDFEVDFSIKLSDKNINNSFLKTIEMVKEKWDSNGYLKALFEDDPFAIVINEIVNYKFDLIEFKKFSKNIQQLKLNF